MPERKPQRGASPKDEPQKTPFTTRPLAEDPVRQYLNSLPNLVETPLLTAKEEIALAKTIEKAKAAQKLLGGDTENNLTLSEKKQLLKVVYEGEDARQTFVKSNLRLVVSIAKRYQGSSLAPEDLIQEGNIGLFRAVDKYDWRKGFKFSTYAMWWIRQSIIRAIQTTGRVVRVPEHRYGDHSKIVKAVNTLLAELSRSPTPEELSERTGFSPEKIETVLQIFESAVSLDERVGEGGAATLGDFIEEAPNEDLEFTIQQAQSVKDVSRILETLTKRDRQIIELRFGLEDGQFRSLEKVADLLGLSRSRIQQIEERILRKLRSPPPDTRHGRPKKTISSAVVHATKEEHVKRIEEERAKEGETLADILTRMYWKEEKSLATIARKLQIPHSMLSKIFGEEGIKTRTYKEAIKIRTKQQAAQKPSS